ncbi:hypothetical protein E4U55_000771 [Claviceps digitariae]|nr:hypothetical protein E4U55_000771 [Claviceps digitariae]
MSPFLWALRLIHHFETTTPTVQCTKTFVPILRGGGQKISDMLAADPDLSEQRQSFMRHFVDEMKRQFRGKPTDLADKRPPQ